ncbi:MarR family winged helix-turn-helix transcriptional regulator [Nonomuraea sp. NPDC050556]|uniref:MarR family winged helix-turn-helix transcriptional regulator n=1 Tax=Nonomuraea sp. NPDC050556 TaxID=3364369 RepID=UPI0037ACA2D2
MTNVAIMESLQLIGLLTRQIEQQLAVVLGINSTDLSALEHLVTDGPLTARELADRLQVSTAASTHIVDRLERAGHVARQPHATDRRKVLVVAAEASRERILTYIAPILAGADASISRLSATERGVVEKFLSDVVNTYTEAAETIR